MRLEQHSTKTAYVCYKLYDANDNHIATLYEHTNNVMFYLPKYSDEHVYFYPTKALSAIRRREEA